RAVVLLVVRVVELGGPDDLVPNADEGRQPAGVFQFTSGDARAVGGDSNGPIPQRQISRLGDDGAVDAAAEGDGDAVGARPEDRRVPGRRVHKLKRSAERPRVRKVLGVLRVLGPTNLLDIGSGRGVFVWPLLDAFPHLPVTALDRSPRRVADLEAVR